jgi:hypothetical protein
MKLEDYKVDVEIILGKIEGLRTSLLPPLTDKGHEFEEHLWAAQGRLEKALALCIEQEKA